MLVIGLYQRNEEQQRQIGLKLPLFCSALEVKIGYVRENSANSRTITSVEWYHLPAIVPSETSMKSFARFLPIMVVWWPSDCSWMSFARFSGIPTRTLEAGADHEKVPQLHEMATKHRSIYIPSLCMLVV